MKQVNDLDDHKLVHSYLGSRDEASFRALYRRHAEAMYAVVIRLVQGSEADAEEVIQDAWILAAQKLSSFRWNSALRTWLIGIAINCARNRYRHMKTHSHVDLAEVAELPAVPPIKRPIELIDIERAITQMPDGYREVLLLHDVEGYTHEEIGTMLGIEAGTSKSQLSRARSALRRTITETRPNRNRADDGREKKQ